MTPGRRTPPDLDSFILPLIEELRQLCTDVPAYDSVTQSHFLLKAHLVLTTEDTPAISKIYHLSDHNAIYPCHLCMIKDFPYQISYKIARTQDGERVEIARTKHQYYYPFVPPIHDIPNGNLHLINNGSRYNSVDIIPLRTHERYLQDGQASLNRTADSSSTDVKELSKFTLSEFNLKLISFPESCPFDQMHLFHLGFGSDIYALLSGTFFKDHNLNDHMGKMNLEQWDAFGNDLETAKVSTSWGRISQHVKYINGYKAEDFSNLLIYYLLSLAFNRVDQATYRALQRLVFVKVLSESYEISEQDIVDIEFNLKFIK